MPLSDAALAVLDAMAPFRRGADSPIFPSEKSRGGTIGGRLLVDVVRRIGEREAVVHRFRSSFRTWVAEITDHSGDVAEMALAHTVGSAVERRYQRSDLREKRRSRIGRSGAGARR